MTKVQSMRRVFNFQMGDSLNIVFLRAIFQWERNCTGRIPERAFSLVEVLIGIALIAFALITLTGAAVFFLKTGLTNTDNLTAAFLLEEGGEAAAMLRDSSWSNFAALATGTPYYLFWNGTSWEATTTAVVIDSQFRRTLVLHDVFRRNSDKDIVASTSPDAKSHDPDAREVVVRVWGDNTDVSLVTYLMNLFE